VKKGQLLFSAPDSYRKSFEVLAPMSGQVKPLSAASDSLYAKGYFGPGAAITSPSSSVKAPFSGICTRVIPLDYAVEIKSSAGLKCLIKYGSDTHQLHGAQFSCAIKTGDTFKAGSLLFTVNSSWLKQQGVENICIMTILNAHALLGVMATDRKHVDAVEDPLLTLFV